MSARTRAAAALAGAALTLATLGCGQAEPGQSDDGGQIVSVELGDDEPDRWDCERIPGDDERGKHEVPDCGRYVNGRWVEWSWVATSVTPPLGWTRSSETRATSAPRPKASTAKPARTTAKTQPTPKRTPRR